MEAENTYTNTDLTFKLDNFEGPLDLLLFLITKHKLNINDIPIAVLLEQYLLYLNTIASMNMDIAAEFLEMAARLLYIKTMSLLPREEESERLKRELTGKLIELALIKSAAERLKLLYLGGRITVRKPLQIEVNNDYALEHDKKMLTEAFEGIKIIAVTSEISNTSDPFDPLIHAKFVPVGKKIVDILKTLYKKGKCILAEFFADMHDKSERVAAFLAVLELTRSGRILLNEDNTIIVFNR
ncbi:MAG: segregation/condensation protein A [Ruminococcus sp.]|nr:segregation/condensation protein A [Ruminococcus sp.]